MFKKVNVQLHLTHIKSKFLFFILCFNFSIYNNKKENILHRMDKYSFNEKFDHQSLYPTNHDAVFFIRNALDFKSNDMDKKLLAEEIVIQTCI